MLNRRLDDTGALQQSLVTGILAEMVHKRTRLIGQALQEVLTCARQRDQRRSFADYAQMFYELHSGTGLAHVLRGLRLCMAGKINRSGSARKQKLIWQTGRIQRAALSSPTDQQKKPVDTAAGSLGVSLVISYKDICENQVTH